VSFRETFHWSDGLTSSVPSFAIGPRPRHRRDSSASLNTVIRIPSSSCSRILWARRWWPLPADLSCWYVWRASGTRVPRAGMSAPHKWCSCRFAAALAIITGLLLWKSRDAPQICVSSNFRKPYFCQQLPSEFSVRLTTLSKNPFGLVSAPTARLFFCIVIATTIQSWKCTRHRPMLPHPGGFGCSFLFAIQHELNLLLRLRSLQVSWRALIFLRRSLPSQWTSRSWHRNQSLDKAWTPGKALRQPFTSKRGLETHSCFPFLTLCKMVVWQ